MLSGCATLVSRGIESDRIARGASLAREVVPTSRFHLTAYSRITDPSKPLVVYIEGDGQAWHSRSELSADPTPGNPVGLKLAAQDFGPNVVYLARPCQHSSLWTDELCRDSAYWSNKRFSEEVIASMDEAVSHFASKGVFRELTITGFSGGAAVAVLVAARRTDITQLWTVAGNLDSRGLSDFHHVSRLDGSLDPIDRAPQVAALPQIHFVGGKDKVVPPALAQNFKNASGAACIDIVTVPEAGHLSGWEERWSELTARKPSC